MYWVITSFTISDKEVISEMIGNATLISSIYILRTATIRYRVENGFNNPKNVVRYKRI